MGDKHSDLSEVTSAFKAKFSSNHFTDKYPILEAGFQDGLTHWIFQSYYVELGNELGYQAVIEYPFFGKDYREIIAFGGGEKRSDVCWLTEDNKICCAVEFERYTSNPREKARNLVRYSEEQDDLDLIILHNWGTKSRTGSRLINDIQKDLRDGFEYHLPAADAMLIETVFTNGTINGHTFTHVLETYSHA